MIQQFADCRLNTGSRELIRGGQPVAIEPRTFDLLVYLVKNRDRAVGKDELQEKVWGTIVSDTALTRSVMKLRKALGDPTSEAKIIKTVPRYGYRFVAGINEAPAAATETGSQDRITGIAVLPLVNMSDDSGNDYFSDGIAEEILNLLARFPGLRVASRTSSFALKDSNMGVPEIAEKLGVDIILEGSVRKAGNRVRITMQLIDAKQDAHLWSEIYDRELDDIFAIQSEIASKVVAAIVRGEAGPIPVEGNTRSPKAYDYYLRGRKLFNDWQGHSVRQSIAMFEKAIDIDPHYAKAWAGIANSAVMLHMWWEASEAHMELANSASLRALEYGAGSSEAHTARGFALTIMQEFGQAVEEFETALELDPLYYEAWYLYGRARFAQGELAESARLFEEAAGVRPDDAVAIALAGNSYEAMSDAENAVRCCTEAVRRAEAHLVLNPGDTRVLALGATCLQVIGDPLTGTEWVERALAIAPDDLSVLHNSGCFFASINDIDRALDIFERRFELGDAYMDWIDKDSDFDSIRDHPRFKAMIAGQLRRGQPPSD